MYCVFESNLITHIFRNFGSSEQPEVTLFLSFLDVPKEFLAAVSTMHAYQRSLSLHCTAYSLSMLIFSWNKKFYLLINAMHHHKVIDDVIIQNTAFSAVSQNHLRLHKKYLLSSAVE